MKKYPNLLVNKNILDLRVAAPSDKEKSKSIEAVLDINQLGFIIGLEIINLEAEMGAPCLEQISKHIGTSDSRIRYSYDGEADCFYLNLSEDQSCAQCEIDVKVKVNEKNQITQIIADLPRPTIDNTQP